MTTTDAQLSPTGRPRRRVHPGANFLVYCLIAILIAVVAMNTGQNLLFWVFGVMAAAIVVSGIVSGATMMGLAVRRLPNGRAVAGEPLVIRYAVTNRSRFLPAFGVEFAEVPHRAPGAWSKLASTSPAWLMHAGPRETLHAEGVLHPHRRGIAVLDRVQMSSAFPFGLLRKSISVSRPQQLLILPRTHPMRAGVLRDLAPRGAAGSRMSRRAGSGDDFFGLRDHRPGDGLRQVAWKRTAHRDQLLVIERTRPDPPRIRVAVNLTVPTGDLGVQANEPVSASDLEEAAISLAASIILAADVEGFEVGLTILGLPGNSIPVRQTGRHRDRLLSELARIDLDLPRTGQVELPSMDREGAGLVVVHPARIEAGIVPAGARHFSARQFDRLVDPDGRAVVGDTVRSIRVGPAPGVSRAVAGGLASGPLSSAAAP
ncbi:MAG: DUF58 domain-containing protein [Phycisphaerales bacterium]